MSLILCQTITNESFNLHACSDWSISHHPDPDLNHSILTTPFSVPERDVVKNTIEILESGLVQIEKNTFKILESGLVQIEKYTIELLESGLVQIDKIQLKY